MKVRVGDLVYVDFFTKSRQYRKGIILELEPVFSRAKVAIGNIVRWIHTDHITVLQHAKEIDNGLSKKTRFSCP